MSSPAPKSPEQSDKSKKYDRQLRLWGDHGQSELESATICLVNATAVGCEVLKSLVLPGIGSFIIADNSFVVEDDLGSNFFLVASDVGRNKAAACMQHLQELNADVNGEFVDESADYLLQYRPSFFDTFDVVIASNLKEETYVRLSNRLWDANIPFFYCRSLGFFGSIRLQIKEHCIIETHPDHKTFDLRLESPFSSLKEHFEKTLVTHKVPWVLVLYKALQDWRNSHDGRIPATYAEKMDIKKMILAAKSNDEENYEEAAKAVNTAFGGGRVPENLKKIFTDESCMDLSKNSNPYWIMIKALKDFIQIENSNLLPLNGILPDMTADTESYIALQTIYRQQSLQDADNIYRKCQAILKDLGLSEDTITEKTIRLFCREASSLAVVRGTKIADEYDKLSSTIPLMEESGSHGPLSELYVAMRVYERFLTEYGYIPNGCFADDSTRLKSAATKLLSDCGIQSTINDDLIHEIARYGGAEIHTISAFIGGCAAQEVIKVITKQYKPIDNTFLYNGITSETITLKL